LNTRPDKMTGPARLARAFGSSWRGFAAAWALVLLDRH
jgi:hypothetical protein